MVSPFILTSINREYFTQRGLSKLMLTVNCSASNLTATKDLAVLVG